jgi:hypothetical protein
VISGFNTDIKVGETVFHVQTEDKGEKSRLVLSLIYDRGTILASKRVSYDDVFKGGDFDEIKLADHLNRQHQLICAAVSAGRIEDLKKMTDKARAKANAAPEPATTNGQPAFTAPPVPSVPSIPSAPPVPTPSDIAAETPIRPPVEQPFVPEELDDIIIDVDAVAIIEDDMILEAAAVEVVSELSGRERPSNNKLTIEMLGETKFKGGDRKTINIMVCRGTDRKVIPSAEIMVKILGSSFRPVIFHARSDANGLAKVHLQVPKFDAGRAALLIRAISTGEEIELRRIVTPG